MSNDVIALSVASLVAMAFLSVYLLVPAEARPVVILAGALFASVVSISVIAASGRRR